MGDHGSGTLVSVCAIPEGSQKLSLPEWRMAVVSIAPAERQRYRVRTT